MNQFAESPSNSPSSIELVEHILTNCFDPASPHAIDRYSDSPRVRGIYAAVVEAFPDATFAPLWCVADQDRVVVGGITRATHMGTWRDLPATGRTIEVLATVMFETSDSGVVDLMVVTDSLAIAEQLGVVRPLGPKACERLPAAPIRTGRTPCGDGLFDK